MNTHFDFGSILILYPKMFFILCNLFTKCENQDNFKVVGNMFCVVEVLHFTPIKSHTPPQPIQYIAK